MPLKKTLLLLLCIATTKCYCQAYTLNRHFSTDDGLITNSIGRIEKDNNGFYWFQSQEGFVRFDGKNLSTYNYSDFQSVPLDSGIKNCQLFFISTAHIGEIFFFDTQGKLSKASSSENIHFGQYYRKKILLNSTNEQIKLKNTKANSEYIFKLFNSSEYVYEIIDEHSSYIIGAKGDLIYLEDGLIKNKNKKPNGQYTHFVVNDYLILVNLKTLAYLIFKKGEKVSNIKLSEVNIFKTQQFISVEQCFENRSLLQIGNTIYNAALTNNQIVFSPFFRLPSNIAQSGFFYDNIRNNLLIYSSNGGVYIYNISKFNTYNAKNSFSNIIYSQAVTNRGIITNQDIYKYIIKKEYPLWSWLYTGPICEINNKQLLTATHKSLIITDTHFKTSKKLKHEQLNLGASVVTSFVKTDNVIYISGNTLLKYDIKNQDLTSILLEGIIGKGKVDYIAKSPNANCIYVCADGILREVNTNSKQSTVLAKGFKSEVRHIYYDSSTSVIFVSTRDEGCICVLTNGSIIKLPSGINQSFKTCHYVLQDKQGDYWLPTNNGLYCLLKKDLLAYINKQVTNVTYKFWGKDDGIINEEFNGGFTGSGILVGDSISLSSMEGRVVFHPNIKYDVQKETGRLIIDAIEVNDSSIGTASNHIELEPNFKQLTVKVAYPFINNSKGMIEYRLLGTNDTTWHVVNESGLIDIRNLITSKYTLTIKVGNGPENIKTISIVVLPYWYRTWWMYSLYVFLIGMALYSIFSLRLLQAKNKQLKELEQTKSRLFTTIAHDLHSPINNFTTVSETMQFLIAEKDFDAIAAIGADMDKKSKHLSLLLSNILDWSLDEQGIQNNTNASISIQLLLGSILPSYRDIAAKKHVNIINQVGKEVTITTNEQALSIIIRNLVDNAIKNAQHNSLLNIYAQQNANSIYLQVSNIASDVAISKLKVIQTLLLQARPMVPLADGVGLGLSLMHNNVVKLGGSIKIGISEATVTFYVELPNVI